MTPEDREFIIRALAAHAAMTRESPSNVSISEWAEVCRKVIHDFANVRMEIKPKPQTVRLADGRELPVVDKRSA